MGVHSGALGTVNGQKSVRNWSVTDTIENKEYRASNTRGGTGRVTGAESWSGSFGFYGHTPLLDVLPGRSFSFLGYMAPNDDVSGVGQRYGGTAYVESLVLSWNYQTGEPISGVVNFKGHLAPTVEAAGAQVFDPTGPTSDPNSIFSSIGTKITYAPAGLSPWTDWCNLVSTQLTLTNMLQEYVNSCTVVDGRLWKGQRAGNFDWTLQVTEQDVIRSRFQKGDNVGLRLYVDASDYIELVWAKVGEFGGITVDVESAAIIQQTANFAMNGFLDGDVGRVVLPDESILWGLGEGSGSG